MTRLPPLHVQPDGTIIWNDKSEIIAECVGANFTDEESIEHARLIVAAVNSHADLLAAAKFAMNAFSPMPFTEEWIQVQTTVMERKWLSLRAAIARAEEA